MDCMKIQFDGVPTSAKTAVMLEPYERQADEVETLGLISYPREQIIANVVCWDALGLTVKMHAAGDGAVRIAVDAVEAAREANGNSGLMHDVFHISFADRNDFARMRDLGGALEFSPYRCNLQPIVNDIRYAVGEQRMQGWIPLRDGMDSGALVIDVPSTVLHRTRAELVFLHRELEYRANSP
jgi:predicted amidohydrolase YtcJ